MKIEYIYQWQAINKHGKAITGESIGHSKKVYFNTSAILIFSPIPLSVKKLFITAKKKWLIACILFTS
ncbi:hypothetical protein [Xenorhabdus thailandensis]|uniref:hypothetical protein n=1 Tax=Xenorhabdus thailandensis TaxID=3136255 RepID=UPI0030F3D85B